ncbi:MAG: hydroxymethylglutaryl-CoA reductase, degradative [Labilithrix sp.]|nr:hydroxymethylglutaryl-CoA reductase, degradative [Labilithrix sp.]MCW5813749.1 hydroxymethylglutaryl-CoA reductase, degradative [Labilithrix sp.]
MKTRTSSLPGFYKVTVDERRNLVSEATGVSATAIATALDGGGLSAETADKFVENVLGTYGLPYGVTLNVRVNGQDHVAPMVVEEPSVVAAASNAAKMVRAGGGFQVEVDPPVMISQVQIIEVKDRAAAKAAILAAKDEILARADAAVSGLVARGGGARGLEVRELGQPEDEMIVVHILVDCRDAMGANLINTVAEAIADRLAALANGKVGLRILSNLCDKRCVRVRCRVPAKMLATDDMDGDAVIDGIVNASRFAELDPYRAATHNKGIMNGIDSVVIATGNDWRAVEAGAHAYAARSGQYSPLSIWRRDGDALVGFLELPLALGTVGGTLRVHPSARLSLDMMGVTEAADLSAVAASVGLASNLAAVRALATDGIQRGHMALHARSVALAAGASGADVERVAALIVEARDITIEAARRALGAKAPFFPHSGSGPVSGLSSSTRDTTRVEGETAVGE